jgi:hypothetical protein
MRPAQHLDELLQVSVGMTDGEEWELHARPHRT